MTTSILIPVFDQGSLLERCLKGLARTARSAEIIVSDDGSSEDIPKVLARVKFPEPVSYVRSEENRGFAHACNAGLAEAVGDVVVFLNSDTKPDRPGWLEALTAPLEDDTVGIVGACLFYPGLPERSQHAGGCFSSQKRPQHLYRGMTVKDAAGIMKPKRLQWVTGACMAIRRSEMLDLGGFCEDYRNGFEDLDLCFRMRFELNKAIHYEPTAQLVHKEGQSAGRFAHESENERLFMERWRDVVVADAADLMKADGCFEIRQRAAAR